MPRVDPRVPSSLECDWLEKRLDKVGRGKYLGARTLSKKLVLKEGLQQSRNRELLMAASSGGALQRRLATTERSRVRHELEHQEGCHDEPCPCRPGISSAYYWPPWDQTRRPVQIAAAAWHGDIVTSSGRGSCSRTTSGALRTPPDSSSSKRIRSEQPQGQCLNRR